MLNFNLDLNRIRMFYEDNEKTVRMAALILVVGLSILFFWIHGDSRTHTVNVTEDTETEQEAYDEYSDSGENEADLSEETVSSKVSTAYVDISGEVKNPGVYKVTTETRLYEVIEMAGGLTDKADCNNINRAEKVSDGQKVIVMSYEESERSSSSSSDTSGYSSYYEDIEGKVNINTADSDELQTIPGIGPSKAQAIIQYREDNGYFSVPEDIMNVTGIGQKTFASIKDKIMV